MYHIWLLSNTIVRMKGFQTKTFKRCGVAISAFSAGGSSGRCQFLSKSNHYWICYMTNIKYGENDRWRMQLCCRNNSSWHFAKPSKLNSSNFDFVCLNQNRQPTRRVTTRRQDRRIVVVHLRANLQTLYTLHDKQLARTPVMYFPDNSQSSSKGWIKMPTTQEVCRSNCKTQTNTFGIGEAASLLYSGWRANVLFVDETRVTPRGADGQTRIYRRRGERNTST